MCKKLDSVGGALSGQQTWSKLAIWRATLADPKHVCSKRFPRFYYIGNSIHHSMKRLNCCCICKMKCCHTGLSIQDARCRWAWRLCKC